MARIDSGSTIGVMSFYRSVAACSLAGCGGMASQPPQVAMMDAAVSVDAMVAPGCGVADSIDGGVCRLASTAMICSACICLSDEPCDGGCAADDAGPCHELCNANEYVAACPGRPTPPPGAAKLSPASCRTVTTDINLTSYSCCPCE